MSPCTEEHSAGPVWLCRFVCAVSVSTLCALCGLQDQEPPQDPLILVRVLEEQGDIMVNGKQMCLQVGSVHRMERDMAR